MAKRRPKPRPDDQPGYRTGWDAGYDAGYTEGKRVEREKLEIAKAQAGPVIPAEARPLIARLCKLQSEVARARIGFDNANDCFCGDVANGGRDYSHGAAFISSGEAVAYIERVVRASLVHPVTPNKESP